MIQATYSAVAGMVNQQIMMEVITNNLANVSTSGYKRDELSFSGMLNPLPAPEVPTTNNVEDLDTISARFATDYTQGNMQRTDNPLDLALEGDGFFVVQHANEIRYTRSGNLSLNGLGQLVTAGGYPVLGVNGVIQIQGNQVDINDAGQIIVDGNPVAQLRLASFQNSDELMKAGNNTFVTRNTGVTEMSSTAGVKQGFIEMSNVNPIYEMIKMVEAMRIYESYQKTAMLVNETLEKANNELGKVSV